VELIKKDISK